MYGMGHLQENRMVHADVRPSLVGVPIKREENFRLLDRLGDSSSPLQVQIHHLKKQSEIYTAPEVFKAILKGKTENFKYNPFKADIFSLGLVILEAALFTSVQNIYDMETGEIRKEKLIALVEAFIEKYPDDFILQETLMIMLEFSPKLRQEPTTLLKSIRKMERVAKEKGEAMVSQINFHKDALVNQVEFTESGFRLKDSGKVQYSFYHRYEANLSKEVVNTEDVENEMRTSLVKTIKDRGSQIGLKGKTRELDKPFEKVQEDIDGEVSRENSKHTSRKKVEEEREFVERNTLEQMILDNVGIDLSAQHDVPGSRNQFTVTTIKEENGEEEIKMEGLDDEEKNESDSEDPQVEEIKIENSVENKKEDLKESKQTEELEPELQELVNPANYKKNEISNEVYADYVVYEKGELMSSREFINKESSGPREVDMGLEVSTPEEEKEYAKEYEFYEGEVQPLVEGLTVRKKEEKGGVSKEEVDRIIEDKIEEIIQEEVRFQQKLREQQSQEESEKVEKEEEGIQPSIQKKADAKEENIFRVESSDPEYPSKVVNEPNENNETEFKQTGFQRIHQNGNQFQTKLKKSRSQSNGRNQNEPTS